MPNNSWPMRSLPFDLRADGQARVERNAGETFDMLRDLARDESRRNGSVTADRLRELASIHGIEPHHFNVWGAVFRGRHWVKVREVVSTRPEGHGNRVFEWRYVA